MRIEDSLQLAAGSFNVFIEQMISQLRADAAAVLLYDHDHQELTFAAERGFHSSRIKKVTTPPAKVVPAR